MKAVAVSYLFSFVNPEHELRTRELIEELWPEARVSLSHEVLPRWREYERTSTTVLDAYLKPLMHDYMAGLEEECERGGIGQLLVLRSNGGVMSADKAREQPVALVRSGPSGGIMASAALGTALGLGDLIACDMGGTSFEACLLPASRARVHEPRGARVRRADRADDGRRAGDRRRRRQPRLGRRGRDPQGRPAERGRRPRAPRATAAGAPSRR